MSVIKIDHLTKDYGNNRGVFDVSFEVEKGSVYGFVGPNGAGKTTTIRHIMGFSKPQKGMTSVNGIDSWENQSEIQKNLGYLPGEIALPESLTGSQFLKMMAELRDIKDMSYTDHLLDIFELNPSGSLKRMALGQKRKLAIVTAFIHDPDILVLDEPTSGLDPIMQDLFIKFILTEKDRGKTILMSSHIFAEIDATCDKISMIKDGKIVSTFVADELRHNQNKVLKLEFASNNEYQKFIEDLDVTKNLNIVSLREYQNQVKIEVEDNKINDLFKIISNYELKFLSEIKFTLEDYFLRFYESKSGSEEVKSQ
ncbi:MAG: ABC transporter ATP-binding protein [Anaerolineales bacterium]|nr:MAG: ABC transporter ATP-binding protein [Anaerolineales bacterium]